MSLPKSKYEGPRRGGSFKPTKLELCRGCRQFVYPDTEICHFCGADVRAVNQAYYEKLKAAREAAFQVDLILRRMQREMERAKKAAEWPGSS
jgi:hypothetical protein